MIRHTNIMTRHTNIMIRHTNTRVRVRTHIYHAGAKDATTPPLQLPPYHQLSINNNYSPRKIVPKNGQRTIRARPPSTQRSPSRTLPFRQRNNPQDHPSTIELQPPSQARGRIRTASDGPPTGIYISWEDGQ